MSSAAEKAFRDAAGTALEQAAKQMRDWAEEYLDNGCLDAHHAMTRAAKFNAALAERIREGEVPKTLSLVGEP